MDTVIVTLRYHQQEVDLELPVSVPLFVLAPILIKSCGGALWRPVIKRSPLPDAL